MGFRSGWLSLGAVLLLASGCSFHGSYSGRWYSGKPDPIFVHVAPPKAPTETRRECSGQKVWVFGYWDWESKWVWVSGACRKPKPPGHEWMGPVLTEVEGGYELVPGHWAPPPPSRTGSGGERIADRDRDRDERDRDREKPNRGDKKPGKRGKKPRGHDDERRADKPKPRPKPMPGSGTGNGSGGRASDAKAPDEDDAGRDDRRNGSGGGLAAAEDKPTSTPKPDQEDDKPSRGKKPPRNKPPRKKPRREGGDAVAGVGMAAAAGSGDRDEAGVRKPGGKPRRGKGARIERGDRSNQQGMAEAEEGKVEGPSFSCKLPKPKVEAGGTLRIKLAGASLKGKPGPVVKLGKERLKLLKRTPRTLRVALPKDLTKAGRISVTYRGERVACGRVKLP